jgi:competence protein ComEC
VKHPLVAPLIAVASGILISHAVRFEVPETLVGLALFFTLTLFAARWSRRLAYACCLITLTFAGVLDDVLHRPGRAPEIDASSQETVLLSGCVVDPTVFYDGRDQFTLELARNADARVTLAVPEGETPPDLRYGQKVEVEAHVRPIRNFRNPGSFDFVGYSARRHIYWNASARRGVPVRLLPGRCGSAFFAMIFALRTAGLHQLERLYDRDAYSTGMMEAILLGHTTKLEKIWTDHFRRTGTFHAIVIAGLHVSVLAGFFLFLLRVCCVPQLSALAVTVGATWIYALVSGANAPVVRATGALTFYLACRFFYRRGRLMNLLAAVALVYLLADPASLFEAGFQLSFLSVAAIAALAVPILEQTSEPYAQGLRGIAEMRRDYQLRPKAAQLRVELRLLAETAAGYLPFRSGHIAIALALAGRAILYAYDMAVLSTVIQIGLALPMAIYFHRISLSGFSANILIVPLLALVMPVGFVAMFTGWHVPAVLGQWLLLASERIAEWHARFEPETRVPDPPVWLSLAFVAALLALAYTVRLRRFWRWLSLAIVLVLFALIFYHPFEPRIQKGQFEFTALDVGQGDSLFIAFPDGKLMLIDGGGIPVFGRSSKPKLDIGEDVVSPYLWSRSIRKIDIIACTHAHDDHLGGVPALIDNFHPSEIWTGANPDSPIWSAVQQHARERGAKIVPMRTGRCLQFGSAAIEVISPPDDYVPSGTPKNNDSLALRITYRKRSFLFTGDMEKPMELRILADGRPIHADVLKVGHHGSKTSSIDPFLDAVRPTFAVISNGFENSFHHPHAETLERLAAHHAGILRTDTDGLITLRTDGDRMFLETFRYTAAH